MTHKIAWRVSLNNGETHTEGTGLFKEIRNQASPWRQVTSYLEKNNLQITSLVLVNGNRTFNLPSAGKNPKFRRFDMAEKPISYRCERIVGRDMKTSGEVLGQSDWYTIGVAEYKDSELQLWVDENNPNNCWTLIVKKEDNK